MSAIFLTSSLTMALLKPIFYPNTVHLYKFHSKCRNSSNKLAQQTTCCFMPYMLLYDYWNLFYFECGYLF